jgi:hypothetical protein
MKIRRNLSLGSYTRKASDTPARAGKSVCGQPSRLAFDAALHFVWFTFLPPPAAVGTMASNLAQAQFEGAIADQGCDASGGTPITRSGIKETPQ